jgi:hypothetical protein
VKIEADIILCDYHAQRVPLVMNGEMDNDDLAIEVLRCANNPALVAGISTGMMSVSYQKKNYCYIEKVEGLLQARCVQEAGR